MFKCLNLVHTLRFLYALLSTSSLGMVVDAAACARKVDADDCGLCMRTTLDQQGAGDVS